MRTPHFLNLHLQICHIQKIDAKNSAKIGPSKTTKHRKYQQILRKYRFWGGDISADPSAWPEGEAQGKHKASIRGSSDSFGSMYRRIYVLGLLSCFLRGLLRSLSRLGLPWFCFAFNGFEEAVLAARQGRIDHPLRFNPAGVSLFRMHAPHNPLKRNWLPLGA